MKNQSKLAIVLTVDEYVGILSFMKNVTKVVPTSSTMPDRIREFERIGTVKEQIKRHKRLSA